MRNTYKLSAIIFIALLVVSAQGVEAQRATPRSNQQNQHYNSGNNGHYGRGQDPRDNGRGNGNAYGRGIGHGNGHGYGHGNGHGYGHHKGDRWRDDLRANPRGHGYGYYGFDQRRGYHFHGGHYYRYHQGRWAAMSAPIGMWVQYMPYGTEVIYTPYGVVYRFGTVYFERARRGGGFVVIRGPRNGRGW